MADQYEIQQFTQDHLQKLAENPENIVYQFGQDETVNVMPANEARDLLRQVRARYLELKNLRPDWDDDQIREQICADRLPWYRFAKSHKLVFGHATNRETTEQGMSHAYYLIFIMKKQEEGIITLEQARAEVLQYGLKHFATGKKATR